MFLQSLFCPFTIKRASYHYDQRFFAVNNHNVADYNVADSLRNRLFYSNPMDYCSEVE